MLKPTCGTKAQGREHLQPLHSSEHLARTEMKPGVLGSHPWGHQARWPLQGPRPGQAQHGLTWSPATGPSDLQVHKPHPPESRGTHLREWMRLNSGSS